MSKVVIAILNWNGEKFLERFLPSVVRFASDAEIVVIDNASTDRSIKFLKKNFPEIRIVSLDKNYGFAEGYNRGLKCIDSTYYILLNSDVEVTKNWWQPLINLLEADSNIGAVQPKIVSYNAKNKFEYAGASGGFLDKYGYPFCRGRILDTIEEDSGQYDRLIQVFWASGAAMAIKAEVFHKLNGFDGEFFAHMEEIDLCWRMQHAGYSIYCEPKSVVYHVGGGTLPNESPFKLYLNFRNNLFMLYKNLPSNEFIPILFIRICLDGVAALQYLIKNNLNAVKSVWKAHMQFYKNLPRLNKQRKVLQKAKQFTAKRYTKSILWEYFMRGNRTFSQLNRD
ncbi:hypothetical protein C7377_0371 [Balneicella halophila]|uniref:Glycosyltransferase 2-like domain-containing protein n=1 Tax=Balneicella halophila TaxID=1537566 RepID=A0A7L4UQM9_BALHA|nr:glycosyltransferase family 2 protein [Balneicella halophila]PVX52076.1 hypothetical protein C7377_0371 [Balneicella halophila]